MIPTIGDAPENSVYASFYRTTGCKDCLLQLFFSEPVVTQDGKDLIRANAFLLQRLLQIVHNGYREQDCAEGGGQLL
jgi:hypothetical protein